MKIHCKYRGIKGFITVYNNAARYQYMIRYIQGVDNFK